MMDWMYVSGATLSSNTGPQSDHTLDSTLGHYVYIEDSKGGALDKARLNTPEIAVSDQGLCLEWVLPTNIYQSSQLFFEI